MPEHDLSVGKKAKRAPVKTENGIQLLALLYEISLIRSLLKWIIRLVTGTCELQRILQKHSDGVRTVKIEECMKRSKFSLLRKVVETESSDIYSSIQDIMTLKNIDPDTNPSFFKSLRMCLEQIYGYDSLFRSVENTRGIKFDSDNEEHEKMLLKLWTLLQPDVLLDNRISKQWGMIGFQGDDPKTDFRGMGMLGLENLNYFASHHTDISRKALMDSHHPKYGYSYAIVGINITSMTYELLCSGLLRTHFFNTVQGRPTMEDFHEVYSFLFFEFDKFWMKSKPENVMAFGRIRDEFKVTIQALLAYVPSATLVLEEP